MKSVFSAFGVVFLSEFADKSQLVAVSLGARYKMRQVVFGFVLAFASINVLSVLLGTLIGNALSGSAVRVASGLAFFGVGLWTFLSLRGDDDDDDDLLDLAAGESGSGIRRKLSGLKSPVLAVAAASVLAELGDKTMIETAALAARGGAVQVWLGSTVGLVASSVVGASVGKMLGARLPVRALKIASGVIFLVLGAWMIWSAVR